MATKKKSNYKKTGIPGLSVRFSWKQFLGITSLKRWFTRKTGIPTTEAGIRKKIGRRIAEWLTGKYEAKTGQKLDMNSRGQFKTKKATKKTTRSSSSTRKTKSANSPGTGDETNIAIWLGILLVSASILFFILRRQKKKKDTK